MLNLHQKKVYMLYFLIETIKTSSYGVIIVPKNLPGHCQQLPFCFYLFCCFTIEINKRLLNSPCIAGNTTSFKMNHDNANTCRSRQFYTLIIKKNIEDSYVTIITVFDIKIRKLSVLSQNLPYILGLPLKNHQIQSTYTSLSEYFDYDPHVYDKVAQCFTNGYMSLCFEFSFITKLDKFARHADNKDPIGSTPIIVTLFKNQYIVW